MAQFRNYGTIPLPTTAMLFLCLKSRYKYALFARKKNAFSRNKTSNWLYYYTLIFLEKAKRL